MIFHVVFLFLSASGNLNSTLITGGLPDFAHPDTVIYRVATSHGKLSIYLRFPGLYDEATISDFNDVSNIAVDHLERAYQSRPILRFPVGHREPIAVYHLSRLGCFFEPVRPTPIDARDIIRTRLRELYDSISRLTARRMVERVGSLQSHSHPFERLADNLGGEAAAYDSVHGANLTSAGSELVFRQELPFVELVVDSLNRSIKRSNLDMSVLMDYFNWPILNSAVTRRSHPDEALLDGPDVISGSPMETSTTVNKTQFWFRLDEEGTITIECRFRKLISRLTVAARDRAYSRSAGVDSRGTVIWSAVLRVCQLIRKTFTLPLK